MLYILPSCTCDTAGAFSRRTLCPSLTSPKVWLPVRKGHGEEDGFRNRTDTQSHRDSQRKAGPHLRQQQEVIEQEAVELLAALGFKQLPAVEELPGTETVGDGVKHELLKDREGEKKGLWSLNCTGKHELNICVFSVQLVTSDKPSHWTWAWIHSRRSEFSFSLTPSFTWKTQKHIVQSVSGRLRVRESLFYSFYLFAHETRIVKYTYVSLSLCFKTKSEHKGRWRCSVK